MIFALISVGFGSLINLFQIGLLYEILEIDSYISLRVIMNTMNIAAPFLCLGFDNSSPILKRLYPNHPFFWNLILFNVFIFLVFIIISVFLPSNSKILPLMLGLSASTSLASTLAVANYYRVEGDTKKYFFSINIADKLFRFIVIIIITLLTHDIINWTLSVTLTSFIYVIFLISKTNSSICLSGEVFLKQIRISLPFIFSSLAIIALTRMLFYASYLSNDKVITAKIDIWLLFTLFILIPVLNKSKIEEALSQGHIHLYIDGMKKSWLKLMQLEFLVCSAIISIGIISALLGMIVPFDLIEIILPLMLGMLIIAAIPNYVQLICFSGGLKEIALISIIIFIVSIICYLPILVSNNISVQFLFVVSAILYCLIGLIIARQLKIKLMNFIRWKHIIILLIYSSISLSFACIVLLL
jgi:hypothetical protein